MNLINLKNKVDKLIADLEKKRKSGLQPLVINALGARTQEELQEMMEKAKEYEGPVLLLYCYRPDLMGEEE
jgi:molybdenum cofactor biosynthesis enzyme MoaA